MPDVRLVTSLVINGEEVSKLRIHGEMADIVSFCPDEVSLRLPSGRTESHPLCRVQHNKYWLSELYEQKMIAVPGH